MTAVTLRGLSKTYRGTNGAAVHPLDLSVEPGELVALLGPSGCGKTTILKMIAGLLAPSSGSVLFDQEDITAVPPERRGAVMVFQSYLLFPYMSVEENVAFGLKMRRLERQEIARRVGSMLGTLRLEGLGSRRPYQLSGGQKQRVALARALVVEPRVLLLDEPLSNLDAHLRDDMRELICSTHRELGLTTVFVTHDQQEAVLLADRVALMFEGRLQQHGAAHLFFERPASRRIAEFFGCHNFLEGIKRGERVDTAVGSFRCTVEGPDGEVLLTIRPEAIEVTHGREAGEGAPRPGAQTGPATGNCFLAPVRRQIYMGTHTRYRVEVAGREWEVSADAAAAQNLEGERLRLRLPAERIWLLRGQPAR
jgi:ABC-type Fe3+/spermidine/putrescine transport system ATPase subunit